ncbi:hypothetical protein CF326_g9443 [Tilletia indica]|nr:hypothetical protein CF326_g9443 [Tilletia indica]
MPRPIPNPQGFNKLPGELVLLILRNLLEEPDISSQTVKTLIKRSMFLARLSWKFKNSTDQIIGLHFHEYLQPNNCGVHDNIAPFHVHPMEGVARQRDYWRHFLGNDALKAPQTRDILNSLTGGRLPALRCVSVDLRAQEPHTQSSLRLWKTKHAPRWIQTSAILSRIGAVSRGIEELNVRLSPQQDLIDLVQDIIVANKRLHTIRIEVDSAVVNGRNDKPSINLHDMFPNTETRAHLRVFMIRAPSCDVHLTGTGREQQERFFDRLHHVEEFTLACSVFNAAAPTLSWLLQLLRHMSKIRFFDFAISSRERNHVPLPDDEAAVPTAILHNLEKMSVLIPEVDGHLFRAVKAPALYKIRIYSEIHIDNWPESDSNQFPNLFIVNISCPGPSAAL